MVMVFSSSESVLGGGLRPLGCRGCPVGRFHPARDRDIPLHPLRRGNHFHLLVVPPEDGMKIPSREGKEGFSLQGWVLPVPGQPTPAPLQRRGIIFMLKGAP